MATANLLQTSVSGGTQNALSLQGDGVFFPKASTTSRLALTLTTTDKGFIVYDTTDNNIYFWNGAAWESVPSSGDAGANGSVQYNDNGIVSGATNFVYDKATGNVGVGTSVINERLGVQTALTGITAGSNVVARFQSSANGYDSHIALSDNFNPSGRIGYLSGALYLWTNGASRVNINTSGNVGVGVTPVVGSGAIQLNAGVGFPATQVASSDANCLDDYEEGTWVPVQGAGLTVVGTFSSSGTYTKVGRLVTITGILNGSTSIATSAIGLMCLGLPFTASVQVVGGAVNQSTTVGANCIVNVTDFYSITAIAATNSIRFSATYPV